jgi:hypothetical protein
MVSGQSLSVKLPIQFSIIIICCHHPPLREWPLVAAPGAVSAARQAVSRSGHHHKALMVAVPDPGKKNLRPLYLSLA